MIWVQSVAMFLTALLFGVVGYYFSLIAKFYRQKFQKGPPYRYLQLALGLLIFGLLMNMKILVFIPDYLSSGMVCAGGLLFTALCYSLYRTMMSIS